MRTSVIIIAIITLSHRSDSDLNSRPLRNFYNSYEEHEKHVDRILQKHDINRHLVVVNNSVINIEDRHKIRHHHHVDEQKLKKLVRCRRYAQNYYDSSIIIRPNCYYNRCRQNYCGYCPTSSCRRRCPKYNCPNQGITESTTRRPALSCNCDPHGSRFKTCDNTGQCICEDHFTGLKCDTCKDTFWKYNTDCVPCRCNPKGSETEVCEQETGICLCKFGFGGEQCSHCLTRFYGNVTLGCKLCDPCDKEGHICHPETGKCVCPPRTTGKKCQSCAKNSWGYEPDIGCKACDCSATGSKSSQCDFVTGRCTCREGFEGEKCDRCSHGFFGYKNCRKCNCHVAGTLPEDCSHDTCQCTNDGCRCKPNVEGPKCNKCKDGTFGIDYDDPLGCRDCFCFGRSKKCRAGEYTWESIRTNQPLQDICVDNEACFKLPDKFTGDLTLSYGGYLTIYSSSIVNSHFKIYISGNGVILETSTKDSEIKLTETSWKLLRDNNKLARLPGNCHKTLTRACMTTVLQNVTKIQIKQSPSLRTTELLEVLLQTASNNVPGDIQVTSIEFCECPKEYTSASCQDPNVGYYRHRPSKVKAGEYIEGLIGTARPCECNGRSSVCDRETGYCYNCTQFTTGAHCELCAEGYFKDENGNCSPCLCPSETLNFATSCTISGKKRNKFHCNCKKGYAGAKCEKCDNEYWGNPLDDGLCKACNCNLYGSESLACDKSTGACKCRWGFTGKMCSDCLSPREVIQNGVCTPCDECTQMLFDTIDSLAEGLNSTLDLFKDGLGPPWPVLNETLHRYNLLSNKYLNSFDRANEILEKADVPDLEAKVERMKKDLEKKNVIVKNQIEATNKLEKDSKNLSVDVRTLYDKIDSILRNLDEFGNSHVDTKEALKEATQILNDIREKSKQIRNPQDYKDFFVHCHDVYTKISEIYDNSDLNPDAVRVKLNDLKKRLGNLNSILNQTDHLNKLARNKNKQNSVRLMKLNQTVSEINSRHKSINEAFRDSFEKINSTNEILKNLEKIYSDLSRINLEKPINVLDGIESDEGQYEILKQVGEHVKDLQSKIKKYREMFNFTDEEWKKINASGAYDTLIKEIEEARTKGQEAENIIGDAIRLLNPANDDSLTDKTNLAKAFSDRLKQRITNLQNATKDFKKVRDDLEKLKYDILNNGRDNNNLNTVLHNLRQQINQQSVNVDDLEKVKEDAGRVLDEMAAIEQKVKNLNITTQYEIIKTYQKYLNLTSNDEISKLMDNITLTRMELQNINPNFTYFDKLKNASHNIFSSNKSNLISLGKKIDDLKNKLQFAKEAADSINIAISISNCERTFHVQKDVLKFLSVTFKCTSCNILSLKNVKNESINIDMKDNQITVKYKHFKKTFDVAANRSQTVSLKRIGSHLRVKTEHDKSADFYDKDSFEINEGNFLKVGKIQKKPSDLEACLHKIELNEQIVGLWKFAKTKGHCPGCQKETNINETNVFFGGKGYRNVTEASKNIHPKQFDFQFAFSTFDENSLILLAQDKTNSCSYISLSLSDGRLMFKARHKDGTNVKLISQKKYNNGQSTVTSVRMLFDNQKQLYTLVANNESKISEERDLLGSNVFKIKKSDIFIGGIPSVFDKSCLEVTNTSFLGYLKPSQAYLSDAALTMSYNTKLKSGELNYDKAWFHGNGFLKVKLEDALEFPASLNFLVRPDSESGFILGLSAVFNVYVKNKNLVIKIGDGEHVIDSNLTDINVIEMNVTDSRVNVFVNDHFESFNHNTVLPEDVTEIYLGEDQKNVQPNFKGGISNIILNNELVTFNKNSIQDFLHVEIGREKPIVSKNNVIMKNSLGGVIETNNIRDNMQNTEGCPQIANYETDPDAVKFGDKPNSFIFIENPFWKKDYVLEFQFRTFYPNGILLLSTGAHQQKHFNVLEVQEGKLKLRIKGKKMKTIMSTQKINDGVWHHVQIKQSGLKKKRKFAIALDGVLIKKPMRMPKNNLKPELYVGGVPESFPIYVELRNELHPFRGCMRALKINNDLQVLVKNKKSVSYNNIGQCFPNVERGAYFGGDAYAIYKGDFKVNKILELSFEFRTVEQNGILLSVSNLGNSPALSVELQNGAVVMTIDMGNGAVSNVTNSVDSDFTLCNNRWHNITALYSSSELTVNVDGIRKSWVQSDVNSLMDEIEAPLYVGGLPDNAPSGTLKIKENFKGCIRKLKIEDNLLDWTDMKELNNVLLNACPVVSA